MIDDEFGEWYATLSVQPLTGTGAWGENFAAPVAVPAFWDSQNRVVVTSDGKSVVSDTRLYCGAQYKPSFPEGSKVTLPEDARVYRVAMVRSWPGEDTHIEVNLT